MVELPFDLGGQKAGGDFGPFKEPRHQAAFLVEQRQQEVLDIHRLMLVAGGDGLRLAQGCLRLFGKFA
jgi:hypothetical protein